MSPIAYLCSTTRCHRLLTRPGRCAEHRQREAMRRASKGKAQGTNEAHWRQLRTMAKVRDGHQCQVCGTSQDLTVHLDPRLNGDHSIATIDDCTTLCRYHHGSIDAGRAHRVF